MSPLVQAGLEHTLSKYLNKKLNFKREITIRTKKTCSRFSFSVCLFFTFLLRLFSPPLFFILSIYFSHCVSVLIKRRLDVASVGSGNDSVAVPNFHTGAFKQDFFSSNLFS